MIEEIQRKKAVVGSLLSMTLQKDSRFQFAFWYRVVGDTKKILKMQTLKTTNVLIYRCSVFDVGAVIELRIEGALEEEVINFGPVKFDSYFNKQLEDPKNDKNQFMANLHTKFNQTIPVKIQIYINNNHLHLIFQSRPQNQSHFQLPLKQDWREYQSVFDVSAAKITDLYFRQSENKEKFIKNLQLLGFHAENRNFVLLTFSNLFERNLFLAQIIRRTLYTPDQPRNSQNKQLRCSQPRQSMQNQMDDLFKSSIMPRNSLASEKTYSEMKEVIFTPQIENQQIVEKGFNSNNFGNFLNPENDKKQANDILSNIQEDQMDSHEKSIRSIKKVAQIRDKTVRSTQKIASSSKYNDQDFVGVGEQLEWKKVAQQNKKLYLENKRLRCENNNLKKKLHLNKEENMKICYNIPEFIRREAKQKSKFASQSPSHIIRMTNVGQNELKQTIHEFETTQTLNMVRNSREQFYRTTQNWKSKSSQKMRTSDDHRRMAKTVSMNNRKSVKEILGLRQPKDI